MQALSNGAKQHSNHTEALWQTSARPATHTSATADEDADLCVELAFAKKLKSSAPSHRAITAFEAVASRDTNSNAVFASTSECAQELIRPPQRPLEALNPAAREDDEVYDVPNDDDPGCFGGAK